MTLGDLITDKEASELAFKVLLRDKNQSIHKAVMAWFATESGKECAARCTAKGCIPEYAAYLFEHYLGLK